ncbi:MAG: hypothetical protein OEM82_12470 [Acidobacteriota bacterium]|nr:hypothetical protein [Acidobacteriota bacterium]
MALEAYVLHAALESRLSPENYEKVREHAALDHAKYQKISTRAAKGLLVTGW